MRLVAYALFTAAGFLALYLAFALGYIAGRRSLRPL
jgi:hypothetical protein